ncbi:peptidase, M48 family [Sphingobacterium spiritivorum ATCC 33300]|uniref:Peptidase, M48 family n=1 Tax=Sphingobacterium spiritivorum ATCC 33300 TaxID=525372 RepID=C2G4E7_SPHSI|nr:M48 family metallopeptidase [Sphingobacterium spiritivorum]EEI89948.1 peptidase, M48 family [Sphingobacterium spiritivorum ATCC 33300]QQS94898.1 M48 family metallopeptidase [Sphingobacterium spiritivorum]
MNNLYKYTSMLLVGATLAGCSTVPLTGRRQLSLVSDSQVEQQAAASYKEFLGSASTKVITGTANAALVKKVGNNIAAAVNTYLTSQGIANQYNFNWEFNLIQSDEVNAWCMPGGKVAVYTGILPITVNEAGLATVMGHEIAHAIAKHSSEQMSNQILLQTGGQVVGAATSGKSAIVQNVVGTLYGVGGQLGMLKYSRSNESEADRLGLIFMAMAGYDPQTAVGFWERMSNGKGPGTPEFMSTHPSDARRISDIQKLLPEANKYYKKQRVLKL